MTQMMRRSNPAKSQKNRKTFPLPMALTFTAYLIRKGGYLSKRESEIQGNTHAATSVLLWKMLNEAHASGVRPAVLHTTSADDIRDATAAHDFLVEFGREYHAKKPPLGSPKQAASNPNTVLSDFDKTMSNLAYGGYHNTGDGLITKSDVGFVAATYAFKEKKEGRETRKAAAQKEFANSDWIGTEKRRDNFFVKCVDRVRSHDTYIYKVTDRKGNLGLFWHDNKNLAGINDCFMMRATPRTHRVSDYHSGKETIFNRVVVIENVGSVKNPRPDVAR